MNEMLKIVLDMLTEVKNNANIKVNRGLAGFLADRIITSSTEKNLTLFMEKLLKSLDVSIDRIREATLVAFMKISDNEGNSILGWLRKYPKIASMIVMIKDEKEYLEALQEIIVEEMSVEQGQALFSKGYDIPITINCLSPLSHGGDTKAGNATVFRRTQVLSNTGQTLSLPFYAGNALRGQLRDLLADHFLSFFGFIPPRRSDKIQLWFFHALYAGGALEENAVQFKLLQGKMGANGIVKGAGVYEFRDNIPMLSLLGVALGNRILNGKINVGDLRPCCYEWRTGNEMVASLFEWTYLTKREDNENHAPGENASMIANTECLKAGTTLQGGIDVLCHVTDIERSCLGLGLSLLQEKGYIGANNRRGFGQVKIEIENLPDKEIYLNFLKEKKDTIREYIDTIGGIDAPCEPNINSTSKTKKTKTT